MFVLIRPKLCKKLVVVGRFVVQIDKGSQYNLYTCRVYIIDPICSNERLFGSTVFSAYYVSIAFIQGKNYTYNLSKINGPVLKPEDNKLNWMTCFLFFFTQNYYTPLLPLYVSFSFSVGWKIRSINNRCFLLDLILI